MVKPQFEKSLSKNGVAYSRQGNGPPLLLIHGVGLCAESWFPIVDQLTDSFELVIVDLPGHGQSKGLAQAFETVSLYDYVRVFEGFVDELQLQDFIVCGHSLGSLIAIEMAAQKNSGISGMIALNAVYQRSDAALTAVQQRAQELSQSTSIVGIEQTTQRWFGGPHSKVMQGYAKLCATWLAANTVEAYALAYKTFADVRGAREASIAGIDCPSIFMTGEHDPNSTPAMSNALAQACPQASCVNVQGAAHMMPLTHSQHVSDEIRMLAANFDLHTKQLSASR